MEPQVDHIWPIIPAVSIRPYKGRFFDCPSSCAKGHCVALGCTRACPRAMDISYGLLVGDIIISYPTSASGIIVLLKTPKKY